MRAVMDARPISAEWRPDEYPGGEPGVLLRLPMYELMLTEGDARHLLAVLQEALAGRGEEGSALTQGQRELMAELMGSLPRLQQWDAGIEAEFRLVLEDWPVALVRQARDAIVRERGRPYANALREWLEANRAGAGREPAPRGEFEATEAEWRAWDDDRPSQFDRVRWQRAVRRLSEMAGCREWVSSLALRHVGEGSAPEWVLVCPTAGVARQAKQALAVITRALIAEGAPAGVSVRLVVGERRDG